VDRHPAEGRGFSLDILFYRTGPESDVSSMWIWFRIGSRCFNATLIDLWTGGELGELLENRKLFAKKMAFMEV
jgi:hypothetical protein